MNLSAEVTASIIEMLENQQKDRTFFSQNYKRIGKKLVGEGGFGKVFKVKIKNNKNSERFPEEKMFAVKKIKLSFEQNYSDASVSYTSERDFEKVYNFFGCCQEAILQSEVLNHPNIVQIHNKWIQPDMENEHGDEIDSQNKIDDVTDEENEVKGEEKSEEGDDISSIVPAEDIITIIDFMKSTDLQGTITPEVRAALVNIEGLAIYLTMDLYDMDLESWLGSDKELQMEGNEITEQLISALHYIHSLSYCHCDLKPSNILIRRTNGHINAAIADFGLSVLYDPAQGSSGAERLCSSSSQSRRTSHTDADDMLNFGFIVYAILNLKVLTEHEKGTISSKALHGGNELLKYLRSGTDGAIDDRFGPVVPRCLDPSREKRVTAKQLYADYIQLDMPAVIDDDDDAE